MNQQSTEHSHRAPASEEPPAVGRVCAPRNGADDRDERALLIRAVTSAKSGDVSALDYLYARYATETYRYVNGIVRDPSEAEDITQDVFTKLMTAIRRYEEREVPFKAWLLRVARNAALDYVRSRRAVPCEDVLATDPGYEEIGAERGQTLRDAFGGLSAEQREVVLLRHVAGLSPPEIATVLGKTESSVHGLHHRGRSALRTELKRLDASPVTAVA